MEYPNDDFYILVSVEDGEIYLTVMDTYNNEVVAKCPFTEYQIDDLIGDMTDALEAIELLDSTE